MNIQINAPQDPANDYTIIEPGVMGNIPNHKNQHVYRDQFTEDEIRVLLGEKKYRQFKRGEYCFAVSRRRVNLISGKYLPVTKRDSFFLSQL